MAIDKTKLITREHKEAAKLKAIHSAITNERDRRMDSGFEFQGNFYQSRPEDRENIAGASLVAMAAIAAGASPGEFLWHGGDSEFRWISEDNETHPMDAQTMFAFGQAAMAHKQHLIFAARGIKNMDEIPTDFTDDKYW